MSKTVCIVGAGPSGLVAAKSLLHDAPKGMFRVTMYDAQPRIGGLWPLAKGDGAGLVHPLMIANQSKHTVQFSDLAWEPGAPEFPRAWQVGRYLERYRERYCGAVELRLGWKVVGAEQEGNEGSNAWHVRVQRPEMEKDDETRIFDYLLVASGYFGQPATPTALLSNPQIPVVHSSKYRDLASLLGGRGDGNGGRILVVGGQMSGIEIAGTIAAHLSSAMHSPGTASISDAGKYTVHHLVQRPTWVFPLHTTLQPTAARPSFAPVDIPAYNLGNRPSPLTNVQGHIDVEAAKLTNSIYQTSLGSNQAQFSPLLAVSGDALEQPPFLAMSDNYLEFVRSGLITVSRGKLESLQGTTAIMSTSGEKIDGVAAVVFATGFDASASLSFFPQSVKETLAINPDDLNNTLALAFHATHHPSLPSLGFVGFYRSPYWGVMEMQARFVTALWTERESSGTSSPEGPHGGFSASMRHALASDNSIARTLALRHNPRRSQFPMGDYAFLMQEFAAALDLPRSPPGGITPPLPHNGLPMDILTPARYASAGATREQEVERLESLRQTHETAMAGLTGGKYVARGVFQSLLGTWQLERTVFSRLPTHPSGHFSGKARFLLREGTPDGRKKASAGAGSDTAVDLGQEYLYIEEGEFCASGSSNLRFPATRRYVWRYDEKRDVLSQWFVRTDDPKRADYLFHELEFVMPSEPQIGHAINEKGWEAKAGHLCVEDFYDVHYEFNFAAVNLREWRIGYTVKGPKKDYSIDGVYSRIQA